MRTWESVLAEVGPIVASVPPDLVVGCLPRTRKVLGASAYIFGVFNVGTVVFHGFSASEFERWLSLSAPVTDFLAKFVLAIDQVTHQMQGGPHSARIALVRNVIAFNWAILLALVAIALVTMSLDFLQGGTAILELVRKRVEARGWEIGTLIILSVPILLAGFGFSYTGGAYDYAFSGVLLRDFDLLPHGFFFYCEFAMLCWFAVLCAAALRTKDEPTPSSQPEPAPKRTSG